MKNENQIREKIQDLNEELKSISEKRQDTTPEDVQNSVYKHKSVLNQLNALNWVLEN